MLDVDGLVRRTEGQTSDRAACIDGAELLTRFPLCLVAAFNETQQMSRLQVGSHWKIQLDPANASIRNHPGQSGLY
jgi:hypothetical protein